MKKMQVKAQTITTLVLRLCSIFAVPLTCVLLSQPALALLPELQSGASLGSGGAYTSIADDESAFYLNAAGTARRMNGRQIFVHNHFLDGAKKWNLKAGFIDGITEAPLTFGFLFSTLNTAERKKDDYIANTSFNWENYAMIGLSHHILRLRQARTTSSKWAYGLDSGVLIFPHDIVAIGVHFRNFYRTFESTIELPRVLVAGLSLNLRKLRISVDGERNFSTQTHELRAGLEYSISSFMILRGGYFTDRKNQQNGYTTGVQIHYAENVSADFAFVDFLHSDTFTYTAGMKFNF